MNEDNHHSGSDWFQPNFPVSSDILPEIFTYLDNRSISICRLVCQQWNEAIVTSGKLMRRLKFQVWDAKQLDGSYIQSNIRSLCIERLLPGPRTHVQQFFTEIGNTVESIDVNCQNFIDQNSADRTFSALFASCSRLQKLIFLSEMTIKVLRELTPEEVQAAGSNIRSLTLTLDLSTTSTKSQFSSTVRPFILSLPSLHCIKLLGWSVDLSNVQLVDTLMEHMERFPGSLKAIEYPVWTPHFYSRTFIRLLLTAVKTGLKLELNGPLRELDQALEGASAASFDPEAVEQALKSISNAEFRLTYWATGEGLRKLALCTGLSKLSIRFHRFPVGDELSVLRSLPELNCLQMIGSKRRSAHVNMDTELENPVRVDILQPGLPSLESLSVCYQLFNPVVYEYFHSIFPNLVELSLQNTLTLPNDLFRSLGKLDRLESLVMVQLLISDEMLVEQIQVFDADGQIAKVVPVIGSLQHLKNLRIEYCNRLTDLGIRDGIANCEVLEYVRLTFEIGQFSAECLNALVEARSLELKEQSHKEFVASVDSRARNWNWFEGSTPIWVL